MTRHPGVFVPGKRQSPQRDASAPILLAIGRVLALRAPPMPMEMRRPISFTKPFNACANGVRTQAGGGLYPILLSAVRTPYVGHSSMTPISPSMRWKSTNFRWSARIARGGTFKRIAVAANAPLASPMLHSIEWTRHAPLVIRVVPRFLQAGRRLSTRVGKRVPRGIWKGYVSRSIVLSPRVLMCRSMR